jgi:DNA replication protein DnaC
MSAMTAPSTKRNSAPSATSLDPLAAKLASVGLDYPASCLPELIEEATREKMSPVAFLEHLLTQQLERKDERRVTTMLKLSGLPPGKTLEDFDWTFQPRADRRQIESLATCSYVRDKTNVLFLGPPGVGKSHLAAALGVKPSRTASPFRTLCSMISCTRSAPMPQSRRSGSARNATSTARSS